jgi:hypothetical protein
MCRFPAAGQASTARGPFSIGARHVAWLRLFTAGGDRDDAARYVELLVPAPSLTRGLMGPSPDTPASRQDALLT